RHRRPVHPARPRPHRRRDPAAPPGQGLLHLHRLTLRRVSRTGENPHRAGPVPEGCQAWPQPSARSVAEGRSRPAFFFGVFVRSGVAVASGVAEAATGVVLPDSRRERRTRRRISRQSGSYVLISGGTNWMLVTFASCTFSASGTRWVSMSRGMSVWMSSRVAPAIAVNLVSTVAGSAWSSRALITHRWRRIRV